MEYRDHLSADPNIMLGKPVIRGTRVTVELILERLGKGMSIDEILLATPGISKDDILACLSYSSEAVSKESLLAG
ncbi:DUF433 domain-containing protein [Leptospira fainei]|nr:DUF433 domain-containing protein [Leptospira fainei]